MNDGKFDYDYLKQFTVIGSKSATNSNMMNSIFYGSVVGDYLKSATSSGECEAGVEKTLFNLTGLSWKKWYVGIITGTFTYAGLCKLTFRDQNNVERVVYLPEHSTETSESIFIPFFNHRPKQYIIYVKSSITCQYDLTINLEPY